MTISIKGLEDIVIPGSPYIEHDTYVTFEQCGEVVGTVKARFDFTDCPPELHTIALGVVSSGQRIMLPRALTREEVTQDARDLRDLMTRRARPWWKTLLAYLAGRD